MSAQEKESEGLESGCGSLLLAPARPRREARPPTPCSSTRRRSWSVSFIGVAPKSDPELEPSRRAATSTTSLRWPPIGQNDCTIPAGGTSPEPSRQGVDDVRTASAYNYTGVGRRAQAATWRRFVREGCVRQARGADTRVRQGGVRQPGCFERRSRAAGPQLLRADRSDSRPAIHGPSLTTLVVKAFRSRPLRRSGE